MINGTFGNYGDRNSRPMNSIPRNMQNICTSSENKENLLDFMNSKSSKKLKAQYLYADPSFIRNATICDHNRQQGGSDNQDVFYDCTDSESEKDRPGVLKQQLQLFEVINEIKNAAEFKGILKQMAYNTHVLYRTFRHAYCKTKRLKKRKVEQACAKSNKAAVPSAGQMDRGDMNPWEVANVEVPKCMHEYLEDVHFETEAAQRRKQQKYTCNCGHKKCSRVAKICPKCLGYVEDEIGTNFNKKCSQGSSKPDECIEEMRNVDCEIPCCLMETAFCEQYGKELQHLSICEKCALARGEAMWATEQENIEPSSETCQDASETDMFLNPETLKASNQPQKPTKQVLNLSPLLINLPLQLEIDAQNCQSSYVETGIQIEARSDMQNKSLTCIKKHQMVHKSTCNICSATKSSEACNKAAVGSDKREQKSASEMFYPCTSKSDIITTHRIQNIAHEKAICEVIQMMKKHMLCLKEPAVQKVPMESRSVQTTSEIPVTQPPPSKTQFAQTSEIFAKPAAPQVDPQAKANKLRGALLNEVRAALQTSSTKNALKELVSGKRFSIPTRLEPKEIQKVTPRRFSAPVRSQATPISTAPLRPLAPITAMEKYKQQAARKPEIPPKPAIAPKPLAIATEAIQKDTPETRPVRHYKRSEIRNDLRERLQKLLEPDPSKREANNEILLDLYELFHPEKSELLNKQMRSENAYQDIRYLLEPEDGKAEPEKSPDTIESTTALESNESILQNVKYILNPKSIQKLTKKRKYSKEIKEKILQSFYTLLKPRSERTEENQESGPGLIGNLRFMLNTGLETMPDLAPGPSRPQQLQQDRAQKSNTIRDSVLEDLKYLLHLTNSAQNRKFLEDNIAAAQQQAAQQAPAQQPPAQQAPAQQAAQQEAAAQQAPRTRASFPITLPSPSQRNDPDFPDVSHAQDKRKSL